MKKSLSAVQRSYLNRELSQLEFNHRVLSQAEDRSIPTLERLRYLCISSSNLDEFFEIRVAGLKEQEISLRSFRKSPDNLSPSTQLASISERAHQLVENQYRVYNHSVLPDLAKDNIYFLNKEKWRPHQTQWLRSYFYRELLPVLSPVGLDPSHPFPKVLNKNLCFAVALDGVDAYGPQRKLGIFIQNTKEVQRK